MTASSSAPDRWRRGCTAWAKVNGGVLACAALSHAASRLTFAATHSHLAAAAAATATLYALVYSATALNLRGRPRTLQNKIASSPIALSSIVWHPLGSCVERLVHERYFSQAVVGAATAAQWASWPSLMVLVSQSLFWWLCFMIKCARRLAVPCATPNVCGPDSRKRLHGILCARAGRLLAFELAFDGFFYVAHRGVHAHPVIYKHVHKCAWPITRTSTPHTQRAAGAPCRRAARSLSRTGPAHSRARGCPPGAGCTIGTRTTCGCSRRCR